VRNKIGVRRRRRLEKHLAGCEQCEQARERLELINTRLRTHRLPWTTWSAGLTSTLKAQVTGWLGTSAVTFAGSGALAMAMLVPLSISLEPTNGTGSRPAATAGWTAGEDSGPTSDLLTPPASRAAAEDQRSTTTATTSADMAAGAPPRDGATPDAMTDPLAADDNRALATEEDSTDGEQDDDDGTKSGDCQGTGPGTATAVGGRAGCGGKGQSNTDEDNQGPSSRNGGGHVPGASNGHGQRRGSTRQQGRWSWRPRWPRCIEWPRQRREQRARLTERPGHWSTPERRHRHRGGSADVRRPGRRENTGRCQQS
jgi:hypothetical protein